MEMKKPDYQQLWDTMTVNFVRNGVLEALIGRIKQNQERYEFVAGELNCNWQPVAAIHYRESSLNFLRHLHNGDPLTDRTVHVPKGRPVNGEPPFPWEISAIDALSGHGWGNTKGMPISQLLEKLERYNGMGYAKREKLSPYLWSWTNHYTRGKYVADGKFDANFIDQQCGVAPILKMLL